MVKTKFINSCGSAITVVEGNAGIYRDVRKVPHGGSYVVEVDPNNTYREYSFPIENSKETLFITSDDFIDNATIEAIQLGNKKYGWKGTTREEMSSYQNHVWTRNVFNRSAWTRFFKLLWNGNSSLR